MMRKVIVAAVLACSQAGLCLGATATTGGTAAATDTNGIVDTNGTADTNGIAGTATATDDTAGTPTTDGTAGTPTTDGTGGTPTNGTGGTPTTGGGPRFPFGRLVPGVDGNGDMDLSALPEGMERVGAAQGVCVAKFGTDDEFSSSSSWQQIVADLFNKTEDLEKSVGTDEKKKQDIDKKLDEALKSPSKDLPKNAKVRRVHLGPRMIRATDFSTVGAGKIYV